MTAPRRVVSPSDVLHDHFVSAKPGRARFRNFGNSGEQNLDNLLQSRKHLANNETRVDAACASGFLFCFGLSRHFHSYRK